MTASAPAPTSSHPGLQRHRRWSHAALRHFVRDLSYGTDLTFPGLLGYWIQQML